ncbi:MAG: murein biosynthesis integral membrane protein MurJ [Deltaproteobacteria bacterium HGW-Deltaproteobacteria-4]|nr:MAG: murein biosynthesis integral membrane protein MurJ [Deltaproteobacteria bacterium HGW-Deltaproteobacteria-4]
MSEKKQIVKAAGILGFATILSRILGMVRDMVVSRLFGAGMATDAFFGAFMIPNLLRRFFAEGALTAAFVPIFSEWREKHGDAGARELANICFTLLTIVMAGITLLGILFSPLIVQLFFPGFSAVPGKLELTITLNRLLFPYIFFISLVALCMGILNTLRHFFTPAISTVFLNLAMIGSALLLHQHFAVPIVSLAIGVLVGGLLQLLLQLPVLWSKGYPLRLNFNFHHPALKRITLLMAPAIFGVGVYYLNITVSNILASLLPQGSVSYLYYAQRLFEFPQGVFVVAVAQAVLPSMSRQAALEDFTGVKDSINFGLRLTLFVTIPAAFGLMLCAIPLFSLLFMGGAFTFKEVNGAGAALRYYALGLAFVALIRVLAPAFYALKDTRTPVLTALAAFFVNLLLSLILMGPMLHAGLALATTLAAAVNMILLLWFLRRRLGPFGGRAVLGTAGKAFLASLPMALFVGWVLTLTDWSLPGEKLSKGLILGSAVAGGILLFFVMSLLLRCPEAQHVATTLRRKILRQSV